MSDSQQPVPGWHLQEAGRCIIRWGRLGSWRTGEDIERGATAVRRDPQYRAEVFSAAYRYADTRPDLARRLREARDLLDAQPLPYGRKCWYSFPLPSWMGADQDDPCRCDLHDGHDGPHECEHTRAKALTAVQSGSQGGSDA
jgi:hypothetical protein